MENKNNDEVEFEKFARERLDNHLAELRTRYNNQTVDEQTKKEAFETHRKIFAGELDERIKNLGEASENGELEKKKAEFLDQLSNS